MGTMAGFFTQLEEHVDLEPAIIRNTKVHKVLKGIVKLSSIPKDEEFNFKKRSAALLETWNKRMAADGDAAPPSATEPKAPISLPVGESKKEESAAPETNGEAVTTTEPEKTEGETTEGAEKEVEEKAEEAAKKLDEKVEEVAVEKEESAAATAPAEPAAPAETKDSIDVLKDVEMSEPVPDETAVKEPQATVEDTATETV